jgi:hypothetical protein
MSIAILPAAVLAAVTVADKWTLDPVAWSRDGSAIIAQSTSFAFPAAAARGRRATVSARVVPEACDNKEWATLGIALHDDDANFWHLALVKSPEAMGWQRYELAEMLNRRWPSQNTVKCTEHRIYRDWEYGKAYDLALELAPEGISGRITAADTGETVFRCAYAFGDEDSVRMGRPAAHSTGQLRGRIDNFRFEVGDKVEDPPVRTVPYEPVGADTGVRERPTGFFHFAKVDGRDWAIDPLGRGVVLIGIDHVQPWGMFCESLKYSPYGRHVQENYPSLEAWGDETLGRLKAWGFTMLGAGCDTTRLAHRGLVHTVFLDMGNRLAYSSDGEWAICEGRHAPCTAFPNVFHPEFEAACEYVAAKSCAPNRDDPWIVGYFIDNELCWWGGGSRAEGMFDAVMKKPDSHGAKKALVKFLGGRPATPELKVEFLRLVAERYFKTTSEAIRRHDPNHMVLGCRFAGFGGAHEAVWREAAKYCDLVTFNCYPWADLDRRIVLTGKGGEPITERFRKFHETVGRPMLVTEWSFPALDTGRPCMHGAGQRFRTQAERVQATELFAKTMLSLPFFVGYDYFMWVDQPAPGMNRHFPEDSNYGLVQENGAPHKGITEMFAKLHRDAAKWRKAAPPKELPYVAAPVASDKERFFARAGGDAAKVEFTRDGDCWTLSNDAGIRLSGRIGARQMVEEVSRDGVPYGRYGAMVMTSSPEWIGASRLVDVSFERRGPCGVVTLTSEGSRGDIRFRVAHRLALAPGCRGALAEIASLANTGDSPISVARLFMCPTPVEASPDTSRNPPNLWKGFCHSAWVLSDGRKYGVFSHDESAASFNLWIDGGGAIHPDAIFKPESAPVILQPGETYVPSQTMSAVLTLKRADEQR